MGAVEFFQLAKESKDPGGYRRAVSTRGHCRVGICPTPGTCGECEREACSALSASRRRSAARSSRPRILRAASRWRSSAMASAAGAWRGSGRSRANGVGGYKPVVVVGVLAERCRPSLEREVRAVLAIGDHARASGDEHGEERPLRRCAAQAWHRRGVGESGDAVHRARNQVDMASRSSPCGDLSLGKRRPRCQALFAAWCSCSPSLAPTWPCCSWCAALRALAICRPGCARRRSWPAGAAAGCRRSVARSCRCALGLFLAALRRRWIGRSRAARDPAAA